MQFEFSEEDELFRQSVREFAEKNIAPIAADLDKKGIPDELFTKMAEQGLLGVTYDEQWDGMEATWTQATIAGEEIAKADISVATAVFYLVEASWGYQLNKYGTQKAKEEVLPKVTSGEWFCGVATTEPTGGSDVVGSKMKAEKKGGEWVLNGEKCYISGVSEVVKKRFGGGHLTTAHTKEPHSTKSKSLFFVPGSLYTDTSEYDDMGRMGISTGSFVLDNAHIPEHYLVGEENKGFYYAMEAYNQARTIIGGTCVGAAKAALNWGIEYIKERELFGKKLANKQGIRWELADLYAKLEGAELIAYKAAWALDKYEKEGKLDIPTVNKAIAVSKYVVPTVCFDIINEVMNWAGAFGYTKECPLERGLRGVRSYSIGAEGAKNVMKLIIARDLLGREYPEM